MRTDRQKQVSRLDKLASEIVRKRAIQRSKGCERCGKAHDWQELQCCHFVSRTIYNTRWNLSNMTGLCAGCHMYIDRDDDAKNELFNKLIGEQQVLFLKAQKKFKGKTDLDLIELYLKEELKGVK